ncbi:hypothetical protein ACFE04_024772 [Oxalis oulophora]
MADSHTHSRAAFVERDIDQQIFQRYPLPEKEYQSFSLIYHDRSLDLICKDKDEAEVWFVGLKELISHGGRNWKPETSTSSDTASHHSRRHSLSVAPFAYKNDIADIQGNQTASENISQHGLGRAFSNIISYTAANKIGNQEERISDYSSLSAGGTENSSGRASTVEAMRVSLSSAVSTSSQGSCQDDFDALGDVFIWGKGISDGILPKALESTSVLDVKNIACGGNHALLVTKHGEIFSWGEESGGRLGHGTDADVSHPKVIDTLSLLNIDSVACGEYHSCAITVSGDLYSWGDGTYQAGMLGHGSEASHWFPKKIGGVLEGKHVIHVSCGPWHTALVTSSGQLFTFGDGTFGALGHGDRKSSCTPQEVESLRDLRTIRVSCGVWHTAAVVEVPNESSPSSASDRPSFGKLFTWGDGDNNRLGHGNKEPRLVPECVAALADENICKTACGHNLTIALTTLGQIYTMGSDAYGQLGSANPIDGGKVPSRVKGKITDSFVEEVACGSYHVAVLTSDTEVYTWGKNANGQLGHGDKSDRNTPTLVSFLKEKQVKSVSCGSNSTAIICIHKWVSNVDHSLCTGCRNAFGFRRKRHNCYNCGLVFCRVCSSRKSLKAALAPSVNKPYRVCDDCYMKLKKIMDSGSIVRNLKIKSANFDRRESIGSTFTAPLSRLSSFSTKRNMKLELQDSRVFPTPNGRFPLGNFYPSKVPGLLVGTPKKVLSISVPGTRMPSRATSPISGCSSPRRSSGAIFEDSKLINSNLTQEVVNLRVQVEDLTAKSQRLEAELQKTTEQLKEVSKIAADETEKCRSAKEVVRSLTTQLKDLTERLPEKQGASSYSTDSHGTSIFFPDRQPNGNSGKQTTSHGSKAQSEKPDWVIQDEPGVYITLSSLPDGGIELKRVRFSRKHFTEERAEKWWAENGEKYEAPSWRFQALVDYLFSVYIFTRTQKLTELWCKKCFYTIIVA